MTVSKLISCGKQKMILVAILLIAILGSLTGCGKFSEAPAMKPETSVNNWQAPAPTEAQQAPAQTTELQAPAQTTDTERYETEAPTENDPTLRLDYENITLDSIRSFCEGIAWVQYQQDGQIFVSAVREDGEIVVTFSEAIRSVGDFDRGLAYVTVMEGPIEKFGAHYTLPYSGGADYKKMTQYDIIVDSDGNRLYDTRWAQSASGNCTDEIVCHGNGKFVVLRHESGLTEDVWKLGTIDAYGNTVDEFTSELYLPDGSQFDNSSFHRLKKNYEYSVNYMTAYNYDTRTGEAPARYLGDDWYVLDYLSHKPVLYNPGLQLLLTIPSDHYSPYISDGRLAVVFGFSETISVIDVLTGKSTNIGEKGTSVTEDMVFSKKEHAYLDLNGRPVITIKEYEQLEMDAGPFYGDYAVLTLTGADKKPYVSVIDRSGSVLFTPMMVSESKMRLDHDRLLVKDQDGVWCVYDVNGNLLKTLPWRFVGMLGDGFAEVKGVDDYNIQIVNIFDDLP